MLKIFNTLGRELQEFKPIAEGKVTFYQCGPTVYSRQHIGNFSSAIRGDLIRRSLSYLGYDVNFVRNITDVGHLVSDEDEGEDKMEKGSKKEGLTPEQIAKKYTDLYHQDIHKLNVDDPTTETVASAYVMQMAQMVQDLLDKGFAYVTELAIYFDVAKFPEYTKLSGQKLDANQIGAGHGDVGDSQKRNPYDFAVWFFKTGSHKNALQTWEYQFKNIQQPELKGFPGWHIECSAMAKDTLGTTIDIHMGGREHIPTHHTNEIAQSEAANGVKFTNYWLHHEMLLVDSVKMSKSLGNIYTLEDLEEKGFEPLVYRFFLLQAHYRSKQNFTWEAMEAAKVAYEKIIKKLQEINNTISGDNISALPHDASVQQFKAALEEDFNLPKALAILWEVLKSEISNQEKYATILDFDKVLGLSLEAKSKEKKSEIEYSDEVKALINERIQARVEKNWAKSDEIRDRLKKEFGVEVRDN